MKNTKAVRRPTQNMDAHPVQLRRIIQLIPKCYSDRKLIQRLLKVWELDRRNEYLYDILTGAEKKDLFMLAEIQPILDGIIKRLKEEDDKDKIAALEENKEYFEDLLEQGYLFLVIDGQHRLDVLSTFFQLKTATKPFTSPRSEPIHDYGHEIGPKKEFVPYNINLKSFKDYPETIRDSILDETYLLVSVIKSGNIKELKGLFSRANHGTPVTFFEDILTSSFGPVFRYITDLHDEKNQTRNIGTISKKFNGFSHAYSEENKGIAYSSSEQLLYILSGYGTKKELKLGSEIKKGIWNIFDDEFNLPQKAKDLHKEIINTIADGLTKKKSLDPLKRSSYHNAFIFLCAMRDKNHPQRKGFPHIPVFKVKKKIELMEWFFAKEVKRLAKDKHIMDGDKKRIHKTWDGKEEHIINPHSFSEKCRQIWNMGYVEMRLNMMWEDFVKEYEDLELKGIIVREGKSVTNQPQKRIDVAVSNDFKDANGESVDIFKDLLGSDSQYDIGHIIHKDAGGDASLENLQLEHSVANRRQQNR
jgi:hypothetical protein